MNDLTARVAVHAALADELRLQVVDLLAEGDLTPGELRHHLPVSSNLLAHHLRVLEAAGVVHRRRSEADGRRAYVSLALRSAATVARAPRGAGRVLFVCTANSARSRLAEALWSGTSVVSGASAGTHPADTTARGALRTAERHGLTLPDLPPQSIDDVLRPGDLIVTVCDQAREELGDRVDLHWSIPDPVRVGSAAAFERAFDEIADRITDLSPRIHAA